MEAVIGRRGFLRSSGKERLLQSLVIEVRHGGYVTADVPACQLPGAAVDGTTISEVTPGDVPCPASTFPGLVAEAVDAGRLSLTADTVTELVFVENVTGPLGTSRRRGHSIAHGRQRAGSSAKVPVASDPAAPRGAAQDTLHLDRIVHGTTLDRARDALREIARTVVREKGCPVLETDVHLAELIDRPTSFEAPAQYLGPRSEQLLSGVASPAGAHLSGRRASSCRGHGPPQSSPMAGKMVHA